MTSFLPKIKFSFIKKADDGQAMVLIAVAITALGLLAGLGVDVGYLRYQKQQMQKAADAAVISAASAIIYGGNSTDYTNAGRNDAAADGFTNGTNGITVAVNYPPQTVGDPFYQNSGYVEVVIAQPQPTFFMKLAGFSTVPVGARAVSGIGSASGCIYVLDRVAMDSYKAAGGAQVNSACGLLVNSSDPGAYDDTGGACTSASHIGIVGGIQSLGCSTPTPVTGVAHFSDPLNQVPAPTVGKIPQSCTSQSGKITGGTVALTQGTFCGGIQITGGATVTFGAGTYILYGGGLSVTSTSTINGTGVTFYNTGDANGKYAFTTISINGVSNSSLSAPTTGALAGMLFFEDRNPEGNGNNVNMINGGSNTNFVGALYFPTTQLEFAGNTSATAYTIIVADQLDFVGTSYINDSYTDLPGGKSLIKTGTLAE